MSEVLYELVRKSVGDLVANKIRYLTPEQVEEIKSRTSEYEEKIREKEKERDQILNRISRRVREYLERTAPAFADLSERLDIYHEVRNKLHDKDEEIQTLERRYDELEDEIRELEKKVRI